MNEEVKSALEALKSGLEGKTAQETKSALEAFEVKHNTAVEAKAKELFASELKAAKDELLETLKATQKHVDNLDIKLQKGAKEVKGYSESMAEQIKENFESIRNVRKGQSHKMEVKVVGNMTSAANLTGSVVFTYQNNPALVPTQLVNLADLVPTVQSATGVYSIYRETGSEGSISEQTVPGNAKTQIDYDYTQVNFTANYIAGYARVAKQMIQDLPFLQSSLPMQLRRDYFKAENTIFSTALLAAATASTATGTTLVEKVLQDVAALEALNYNVNGIAMNPADWYAIATTKPNDFSIPGIVTFSNGLLSMNGIPVYKVTWLTAGTYIVGDWTMAKKVVVDGLAVEFFEQDSDNVQRNLITARVESRTVLAIDRPNAFIKGVPAT